MRIGICTTDFERTSAQELFAKIHAMGFECVQFSFDSVTESGFCADSHIEIPESVSESALAEIRRCSEAYCLPIVAVNGTFNMAHSDAAIRKEGIRRFEGFARAVRGLGCKYVSLCSGTRSAETLWTYSPCNDTPQAWRDMAETMRAVCEIAERYDLTLAIETEASNIISTPERAEAVMREVGSPRLKMIMDCANLFHVGEAKAENVRRIIGHAFDVFGRDVVLAHGKDILPSDGIRFCATGEGIVDFPYFLEKLRQTGYAGDMLLHGIYEEEKMPKRLAWLRTIL